MIDAAVIKFPRRNNIGKKKILDWYALYLLQVDTVQFFSEIVKVAYLRTRS